MKELDVIESLEERISQLECEGQAYWEEIKFLRRVILSLLSLFGCMLMLIAIIAVKIYLLFC